MFALKAFEPKEPEEAIIVEDFKSRFSKAKLDRSEDDDDDDMSDFVVPDDADEDYKPVSKKRLGKRRANVVVSSDEEDDFDDVIIRPKKHVQKPAPTSTSAPTMSEYEISTKMKVSVVCCIFYAVYTDCLEQRMMAYLKQCQEEYPDDKVCLFYLRRSCFSTRLFQVHHHLTMDSIS